MAQQTSMPQPLPSSEVKKSNHLIAVAIVMLLIGVAIGVAIGWSIGQSQSQAVQTEYTRIKVVVGTPVNLEFQGTQYYFYFHPPVETPQAPIRVSTGSGYYHNDLPSTQGKTYDILGIEVVVSEVHDDYIILLVKPL